MNSVSRILVVLALLFSFSVASFAERTLSTDVQTEIKGKNTFWESILGIFKEKKPKINPKINSIVHTAKEKLGRKYVWGATGKRDTFDCSGLTQYVYQKNGIKLPRTSYYQAKYGEPISRDELKPGDLVFFDTSKRRKGYVNHVGIYIGDNQFLHASSAKKKVVVSRLNKTFYGQRFKGARRPKAL